MTIDQIQTRYKYIYFEMIEKKRKTCVWECRNNRTGAVLGIIKWYPPWRQYSSFAEPGTMFNDTCHDNISHFLKQLRVGRKPKNKTEGGG